MVIKRLKKRLHNGARVKAFYKKMSHRASEPQRYRREMASLDTQIARAEKQAQLAAKQAKLSRLRTKTKSAGRLGGFQASLRKYGGGFADVAADPFGRYEAPAPRKRKKKRRRRSSDDDDYVGFDINDII